MNEESFIKTCEYLNEKLNEANTGVDDIQKNNTEMSISMSISDLIDSTSGYLETDNEELKNLFKIVFNLACSIKRNAYEASHYKAEMNRNLSNDDKLAMASEMFAIKRKLLKNNYAQMLEATNNVINMGKTK